jgi:hypothetical protein
MGGLITAAGSALGSPGATMGLRATPRFGPGMPLARPPAPRLPMPTARPSPRPVPKTLPQSGARPVPRPIPQPQVLPQTRTADKAEERTRTCDAERDDECVDCPPTEGSMAVANNGKGHSMSDLSSRYQAWVTGFPPPYEWRWNETWWDGFEEPRCTLLEAKANYAFMFVPLLGVPKPWAPVKAVLVDPARRHSGKARPTPPVRVEWHFLQRIVYEHCSSQYRRLGLTNLTAFWNPMPNTPEHDEYQEHREREQREFDDYYRDNPDLIA